MQQGDKVLGKFNTKANKHRNRKGLYVCYDNDMGFHIIRVLQHYLPFPEVELIQPKIFEVGDVVMFHQSLLGLIISEQEDTYTVQVVDGDLNVKVYKPFADGVLQFISREGNDIFNSYEVLK